MADLLNALLDITKLESGGIRPSLDVVPLADILADIRGQAGEVAMARGLTLDVALTGEWLMTDRVLLRQMLQNLVTNGLEYTREGGVKVAVRRDARHLTIEVADTGIGIPAGELERIFDGINGLIRLRGRGFGLGLTIVRQIGRFAMRSRCTEAGQGTTARTYSGHKRGGDHGSRRSTAVAADRSGVGSPPLIIGSMPQSVMR